MTRIIGRLTKIGLGKETTPGTAVAPTFWIPVLDLGYDDKYEFKDNESGFGHIAAMQDNKVSKRWAEGDYGGKIQLESVGLELTGVFGQSPTSVQRTTTGVYDHSYTLLNSNQHKTLTVAVSEPNFSGRYPYGGISTWALETELGDFIRRTVGLVSKVGSSSSETPAYTDQQEFMTTHLSVKLAAEGANDVTLDAATAIKVRGFNFEINKNAEGTQVYGSADIDGVINKQIEITGEIEMYYDDRVLHALAAAGTHQAMRVEMLNPDVIIGTSGSHNPALRFQFPKVALMFPEKDFDNNDVQTITIPFKAYLHLSSGVLATARLTNAYVGTNY
jgi:hypothetical protein